MAIFAKMCHVIVLAALAVPAATQGFLADDSPDHVSRDRVVQQVRSLLGHGRKTKRIASIEDLLRPTVTALPRDSNGSLEHHVARYALYRYFLSVHGWHIKGLLQVAEETYRSSPSVLLKSWMPSLIIEVLQVQMKSGRLGLEELAVLAATVEDLVHGDALDLLTLAYNVHHFGTDEELDEKDARLVARTFSLYLFMPHVQTSANTSTKVRRYLWSNVQRTYPGWGDSMIWVDDVRQGLEYQYRSALRPFTAATGQQWDFTSMAQWTTAISAGFGRFTNIECKEMKNKLLDAEDNEREDGRVRLVNYYRDYLEHDQIHFSECPAYLRHLGALDEQDPRTPRVIVPNIMYSKSNCMATSGFHTSCCIDECDGLLAGLEQQVSAPAAAPALIAAVVSAMPSDTIAAPRNLSAPLRSRLDEIASRHGGRIPLHSRLFAQWMHYAYPGECPYPTPLLSSEPQLEVDDWEAASRRSFMVSNAEARALADLGAQAQEQEGASGGPMPLWSDEEVLLSDLFSFPQHGATSSALIWVAGPAAVIATAFAIYETLRGAELGSGPKNQPRFDGVCGHSKSRNFFV